jgi:mRNA interferase MazF
VVIVTRERAIAVLSRVTVAPVTGTVRDIASEVPLGSREGLPRPSVANCDNLITVPKGILEPRAVGRLGPPGLRRLDAALRFALGIRG